ncbi:hypothetical protein [Acerihabitans arboris]|uniref:Uncharacterized protein n=1 Tax=Acerihabitans arboris TaxID=2691583 RepID=A0A845SEK2_9GAMM|nr:hypothetical protein [Acerihabitans arboris]NDL62289.1 hypothetical protein [Acerihabitans arboris]
MLLFALGIACLAIRNPDPLINPVVYAEDGVWVADALTNGWLNTYLHARPDYFVFFNIFTLHISSVISSALSGNPLFFLPQSIAFVSYGFYSFVSVLAFITIKRISNNYFAFLIYFITLMIPLGMSQNEIIGRLLQIGFYMPFITLCLFFSREKIASRNFRLSIDALITLAAATNPVVFSVAGIYTIRKFITSNDKKYFFNEHMLLLIMLGVLFLIIAPKMIGVGGIVEKFDGKNLIELITARSILYPFVFKFYSELNDVYSIILTIAYVLFCAFSYRKTNSKTIQDIIVITSCALVIYIAATVFGRPVLTGMLSGYQVTFLDRYFMGINIISVFLFVICLTQLSIGIKTQIITKIIYLSLLINYIINAGLIIENYSTRQAGKTTLFFSEQLCLAEKSEDPDSLTIKIYPVPEWEMKVPSIYVNMLQCRKN